MANLNLKYFADKRISNAKTNISVADSITRRKQEQQYSSLVKEREQERLRLEAEESERKNANFFEKLGITALDVLTELGGGLFKMGEGVVDAAVSLGGGIGKIFGADSEWAEDIVKFDATDEWWYSWEDDLTKNSYLNDAPMAKDIVRGIGQQLPTIAGAIMLATPAAPLGAVLMKAGIGGTIVSAGGSGVEEALNEGASFNQALAYGAMQSGIEGIIEIATAGMGKGITSVGKSVTKSAGKSVAKSAGKIMLDEALSEAIEEGASAMLNPLTKTVYQGGEALEEYKNPEFYKDAAKQAFVGGVVGGISGGAGAVSQVKIAGGKSAYLLQQSAAEIESLDRKQRNLFYNDNKYTQKAYDEINTARIYEQENIRKQQENISEQLKEMNDKKRSKVIDRYKLSSYFTAEGDIIPQKGFNVANEHTAEADSNAATKPLISPNIKAYDPSLRAELDTLDFPATSGEVSQSAIKGKKVIHSLPGFAKNVKVVITDTNTTPTGEKFIAAKSEDGRNIVYISNSATEQEIYENATIHEIAHTLEGTSAHEEFSNLLLSEKYAVRDNSGKFVYDNDGKIKFDNAQFEADIKQRKELYKNTNRSAKEGNSEAAKKTADFEAVSELIAERAGEVLGNEQSIRRIALADKKTARRIWAWLTDTISRVGDKNKGYSSFLRQAEKLYAKALKEAYGGIPLSQIRATYDDEEKKAQTEEEALAKGEEKEDTESLAKKDDKEYNETKAEVKSNEREKNRAGERYSIRGRKGTVNSLRGKSGRSDNSYDSKRIRQLQEEIGEEATGRVEEFAREIVEHSKLADYDEEFLIKEANKAGYKVSFVDINESINSDHLLVGNQLFLPSDISLNRTGEILEELKPYRKTSGEVKTAHISNERWNKFIKENPNTFVANIAIQDFLDLTADRLAQREIYNQTEQLNEKQIKNINDPLYLKFDYAEKTVTDHEGRHRMTALNESGYTHADVFIVPTKAINKETIKSITLKSQGAELKSEHGNIRGVKLFGLVKANSQEHSDFVETKFKEIHDDSIRYSLKDGTGDYEYSKGQIAKYVANNSKAKAYARTDAAKIVDGIVNDLLNFGDKYGKISGETRNQIIDKLFHDLNAKDEGYRMGAALDVADIIIKNSIVSDAYADNNVETDIYIIGQLKQYLGRVRTENIKGDIDSYYGTDKSVYGRWGKRKGKTAISPDQIAMELQESGIRFQGENPADIFIEMDNMYLAARDSLKKAKAEAKQKLTDFANEEEQDLLRQHIARDVLIGYDETGFKTKYQKKIEKYIRNNSALREALRISRREANARTTAANSLFSAIEKAKKYKNYADVSAGTKLPEKVVRLIKEISKLETHKDNINANARKVLNKINETYKSIFGAEALSDLELIRSVEIANNLNKEELSSNELKNKLGGVRQNELTTAEIQEINNILARFMHAVKHYDKIFFQGKNISETEIAEKGIHEARLAQIIRTKHSGLSVGIRKFFESIYNPLRVFQSALGYIDNSVTEGFYKDIMDGNRRRAAFVQKSNNLLKEFFESKEFLKSGKESVIIKGDGTEATMTRSEMLSLYLTLKREQGLSHIIGSGKVRLLNHDFVKKNNIKEAQLRGKDVSVDETMLKSIEGELTKIEKEFVKTVREFFDTVAKDAKVETDKILRGVTNALQEDYYPIKTTDSEVYKEVGTNTDILQTIRNFGFNIDSVPNASSQLVIESIFDVVARHISGMSIYYGYAVPITTYNRVMNKKTLGGTLRTEIAKINPKFDSYVNNWFLDIQGIVRGEIGLADKAMGYLRGMLARAVLGLNPKVLLSQTVSLASALSEFNPKYVVKGIPAFFSKQAMRDVLEYSPLMAERNDLIGNIDVAELRENTNKMQGVRKAINKTLDVPLKVIEFTDSHVIASIYHAALNEQADVLGKSRDSIEVKEAAARRTEDVVFRSQQTSDPVGRSSLMRSRSQLVRLFTMFKGDAFQLTSQFVSSIDRLLSYRKMLKSGDSELIAMAKNGMPEARKAFAKSGTAVFMNVTWLALIAMAMKAIKGWNDEDKGEFAQNEIIANLMGMLPVGGEIYTLFSGYDLDNPAYSALNTLVDTAKNIQSNVGSLMSGDEVDEVKTRAAWKKTSLGLAQILGVPLRNIESYGMGIVGNISPATKAEYDALFKTKSNTAYLEAIAKAIEKGDHKAADRYINIMFDSRTGKIKDDKVLKTMRDLIEAGYTNIMPRSLGDEITYNGEKIELTKKQHAAFEKIYSEANDKVKTMVNVALFGKLDNDAKARAIKMIYDFYWNLGLEDLLGEDLENKNILFGAAIPIEQLAMAIAQSQQFEADLDKTGSVVSGSRKAKIEQFVKSLNLTAAQKYMVMGYLGYTNKNGAQQVKTYINSLKLSKNQKETLYEMSGYKTEKRAA